MKKIRKTFMIFLIFILFSCFCTSRYNPNEDQFFTSNEQAVSTIYSNLFFKNLKEGKDVKEALWLSRNEIRRKDYEHPSYWSAFILMGK